MLKYYLQVSGCRNERKLKSKSVKTHVQNSHFNHMPQISALVSTRNSQHRVYNRVTPYHVIGWYIICRM